MAFSVPTALPLPFLRCVFLLPALLGLGAGLPAEAAAQFTGDLLLPRGSIEFEARADFVEATRLFQDDGTASRLGGSLLLSPLTPAVFPALEPEEERLRALTARSDAELRAGGFSGRFEVNDQRAVLRAGWGVLDRITVGATVPLVRRRIDADLTARLQDANVGRNPSSLSDMVEFRSSLSGALSDLVGSVEAICTEEGPDAAACQEGEAALTRVQGFVDDLDSALDDGFLFPLEGSSPGADLRLRWADRRADMAEWNVSAPEVLPLAVQAIRREDVATHLVEPVWGLGGFPLETPETQVELGDLEAHLVVGLLDGSEGVLPGNLRLRSSVEATIRLPTGTPDSTALLAPLPEPRGVAGGGIRLVSDLLRPTRLGLRTEVAWRTFRPGEGRLLAFDPANAWNPATARVDVDGAPGDELRLSATPRLLLAPGLSLGAGWHWTRMGEARWVPRTASEGLPAEARRPALSQHRATVEFRYTGWDPEVTPGVRFPVEVLGRASWAFQGSEGATKDRRVEAGIRVRRDR